MKDLTRILSRYICASQYPVLPDAVRHEGLRAFVNYVGCAAGGSREPDIEIMLRFLAEFNGANAATTGTSLKGAKSANAEAAAAAAVLVGAMYRRPGGKDLPGRLCIVPEICDLKR